MKRSNRIRRSVTSLVLALLMTSQSILPSYAAADEIPEKNNLQHTAAEDSAGENGSLQIIVRTLPGEHIAENALRERLAETVLPEGTDIGISEEYIIAFSPERSPKKRMHITSSQNQS